jgi:hypothetical protein
MKDNFPEFKNEVEKIYVPVEKLDQIITDTLNKNTTKVNVPKRKRWMYLSTAAVVSFGLLIGYSFTSPTIANAMAKVPIIGSIFNDFGDEGLKYAYMKEYSQDMNMSYEDNGINLTIKEVFYDGTRLTISYSNKAIVAIGSIEKPMIHINGKPINFSSSNSGIYQSPGEYEGILDILPTEELPENFEMKLSFDRVGLIPGKWNYTIPVQQLNNVKVINPHITTEIEDSDVTINNIKMGPVGTGLTVDIQNSENEKPIDWLYFNIIDEKGNVLQNLSGSGFGGDTMSGIQHTTFKYLYTPLQEEAKEITIVPYTYPDSPGGLKKVSKPLKESNLPLTLDQGELGTINVVKMEKKEDTIVLYYEVNSEFKFDHHLSGNQLWIENSNGTNLTKTDKPYAEQVKENLYKQEFSLKGSGFKVVTEESKLPKMYDEIVIKLDH